MSFYFCLFYKIKQNDNCVSGCLVLGNCNILDKMMCQCHLVPSDSLLHKSYSNDLDSITIISAAGIAYPSRAPEFTTGL
jgi:hypothetical protein